MTSALGSIPTDVGEAFPQPPVAGDSFSRGHNERERYRVRYVLDSDPPRLSPWDVDTKVDEAEYTARDCLSWSAFSPENTSWGTPLPENTAFGTLLPENTAWGTEHTAWGTAVPQESSSVEAPEVVASVVDVESAEDVEMVKDGEVDEDNDGRVGKKLDVYEDVMAMEDVHGCETLTPLQRDPWGVRQSYPGELDEKLWEGGWGSIASVSWVRALSYALRLFLLTFQCRRVISRSPPLPRIRARSPEIWLV